jgi:transposase InsO family protein
MLNIGDDFSRENRGVLAYFSISRERTARFRDEYLNKHWFTLLEEARKLIAEWRVHYNEKRPHSSLNHKMPKEFAESTTTKNPYF